MERTFSVDDLVGNIWRLGQSTMGRTDSEAAFQEFLKRIPSATNLAAAAVASQAGMDASQQVQQFHQQLQGLQQQQQLAQTQSPPGTSSQSGGSASPCTSSAEALVGAAPAVSGALQLGDSASALGTIPRVPSLDLLRRLVVSQSLGASLNQSSMKPEAAAAAAVGHPPAPQPTLPDLALLTSSLGLSLTPADLASIGASGLSAALQASGLSGAGNPLAAAAAAAAAQLNPAAAAAAALQLNQLSQLRLSGVQSDKDTIEKAEIRRARRMLSNRESARRSRRRKQEHLGKLEDQIDLLQDERREHTERLAVLERRCHSAEEENKRLKEENERLREELRFLRNEFLLPQIAERNSYYVRRERQQEDHGDEGPSKRMRAHEPEPRENGSKAEEKQDAGKS